MEDDDEFGDLYTDVLRPLTASFPPPTQSTATPPSQDRPIDPNIRSDRERTLDRASDSNRKSQALLDGLDSKSGVSDGSGGVKLHETTFGDPNLLDESAIDVVVEERDDVLVGTNEDMMGGSENVEKLMAGSQNFGVEEADTGIGDMGLETMIPGLSKIGGSVTEDEKLMGGNENTGKLKEQNADFDNLESTILGISDGRDKDDSDSDSEDDLQIVLNDDNNNERNVLMDRNKVMGGDNYDDDDDEDEEPLVIVADDDDVNKQQLMEEQEWGGEAADGERKELDDAAKASGGAAVAPKIGYSNHGYHPYHSQFKYVRPGAAPMPGTTPIVPGGGPGQVRPPVNIGPIGGRGRGDWRPAGVKNAPTQKGFHPGYGMPVWGNNASGHSFGGGLEFTLPSHKTVFEVDIDGFEEKPWRLPGIDISDYFNFGLNEESWKEYCKKMEQLRLEATMQSKIRVYESGRTEQEYDPDMPPELAAAAGIHDVPPEGAALAKTDAGQTDIVKGPRLRPPLPTGRAIQVESGYGERLPSIDTRPPRIRDSDAIIEIVLQDSFEDDSYLENNITERPENGPLGEGFREGKEIEEDVQREETEHSDGFSHAYDDGRRDTGRRAPFIKPVHDSMTEGDEISPFPSESPLQYRPDSRELTPECPRRNFGIPQDQRWTKGRRAHGGSPNMTPNENAQDKQFLDNQKEESIDGINGKHSPLLSSPVSARGSGRQVIEHTDAIHDEQVLADGTSEMEKDEMALNTSTTNDGRKDENLMHSAKKQKLSSQVEQPSSQEIDDGVDSKAARSSENSKARSGSSKDFRKSRDGIEEEVVQDGVSMSVRNVKRPVGRDDDSVPQRSYHERQEMERQRITLKGREDSYSRRELDRNSAHHLHMKSDVVDRRKESDNSDGAWQRRNEDPLGRRSRAEETRTREHSVEVGSRRHSKVRENERSDRDENHQSRKQLDNSSWRAHHDKDVGSRHRERDDSLRSRNESMDYVHSKRRKDDAQLRRDHAEKEEIIHVHRESSSRRKRERDDILDQRKKDDQARLRDDDQHYIRQKEEALFGRDKVERQREREEWHRLKQSHEDISKREREERQGMRSGRAVEEKASISHSRGKDDYKGSDKEYYLKDVGRHIDQAKRRDRVENENMSRQRGHEDAYSRGTQLTNDERRSRHERASARYDRIVNSSDNHRVHENKHKDERRKGKESEDGDNSLASSKRKQEDHIRQKSEMVSLKGTIEQTSGEHEIPVHRQSSRSHRADVSSDDEQQDSKRGRSKLERWTSHKERDFSMTVKLSSSLKFKEVDTDDNGGSSLASKPDVSSRIMETVDNQHSKENDGGDPETRNVDVKAMEDKHLDTVAKLKKRSERFKLPLPSEKEVIVPKKMETEPLPSVQSETRTDSEIKPERPARKRRWTSN